MNYPGLVFQDFFNSQARSEQLGGDVGGGTYANGRYIVAQAGAKDKIDYTEALSRLMEYLWNTVGEFSVRVVFKLEGGTGDLHNKILHLGTAGGQTVGASVTYVDYTTVSTYVYPDGTNNTKRVTTTDADSMLDIVLTYKSGSGYGTHYVNGAVNSTGGNIAGTTASAYELSNGKLDAEYLLLQVYDRELTASEVANMFNGVQFNEIKGDLLNYNSLKGYVEDTAGNTLTPTNITYPKIGSNWSAKFGLNANIDTGIQLDVTKTYSFAFWFKDLDRTSYATIMSDGDIIIRRNILTSSIQIAANGSNYPTFDIGWELNKWIFCVITIDTTPNTSVWFGDINTPPAFVATKSATSRQSTAQSLVLANYIGATHLRGYIPIVKAKTGAWTLAEITRLWSSTVF